MNDADIDPEDRIRESMDVVEELVNLPEKGVPSSMIRKAEGIIIIPKIVKAGFIIGGRHGKGIALIKGEDGSWSHPLFVKITGGSLGWQVGVQKIELLLVFRDRETVISVADGEFEIGADASVTAGPVGRSASAGTNAKLEAEIYSYSRSKGLFVGISLDGAKLSTAEDQNKQFYGRKEIEAEMIFNNKVSAHPELLSELKAKLRKLANNN
ncbi:MAG: lipid-binding SYLF domain-containing protein [Balneolaceae bacterium]|nr:lipid-binding SYLF domain-containing protein [Balneolaceae bacterium]